MTEENFTTLVCSRVEDASVLAAITARCHYCQAVVAVTAASVEAVQAHHQPVRYVCMPCVPQMLAEAGEEDVEFQPPTAGQLQEIVDYFTKKKGGSP